MAAHFPPSKPCPLCTNQTCAPGPDNGINININYGVAVIAQSDFDALLDLARCFAPQGHHLGAHDLTRLARARVHDLACAAARAQARLRAKGEVVSDAEDVVVSEFLKTMAT